MKLGSPTAGRRRWAIFILLPVAAALLAVVALIASSNRSGPPVLPTYVPAGRAFSLSDWEFTFDGDFEEKTIDTSGRRLRMRVATRRTRPETVKFLGLRRKEEIPLKAGTRIKVDLDWNHQDNGSGLTAGIVLAPESTTGNPFVLPDTLSIEYIGVPPGKNARMVVAARQGGEHRHLTTEGWPETNKTGRRLDLQKLEIEIGKDRTFRILENGKEVYASGMHAIPFDRARLYLQVSSRSNYPPREIYFDNIDVKVGK
jgi:hypothetical protein